MWLWGKDLDFATGTGWRVSRIAHTSDLVTKRPHNQGKAYAIPQFPLMTLHAIKEFTMPILLLVRVPHMPACKQGFPAAQWSLSSKEAEGGNLSTLEKERVSVICMQTPGSNHSYSRLSVWVPRKHSRGLFHEIIRRFKVRVYKYWMCAHGNHIRKLKATPKNDNAGGIHECDGGTTPCDHMISHLVHTLLSSVLGVMLYHME